MQHACTAAILHSFETVRAERERRQADGSLHSRVHEIKRYQQRRFMNTYSDLIQDPRYAAATRFFFEEVYGPQDFRARDEQFLLLVPVLVKLFPQEVIETIGRLGELHALTEMLDTRMGEKLRSQQIDAVEYVQAWQLAATADEREAQCSLLLAAGAALDEHVRVPLLGRTLHMLRTPARLAGLAKLQHLLEAGFEKFQALGGAATFLQIIGQRERVLAHRLFEPGTLPHLIALRNFQGTCFDPELSQLP